MKEGSTVGQHEALEVPERWRAVVEGRATAETLAALEAEAGRDPQVARLLAAFTPLDAAQEERISRRLLSRSRRHVRRARGTAWALALSAAAALLLWSRPPPAAPVPHYLLEAAAGESALRDSPVPEARGVLHPGSALSLVLRPEAPNPVPMGLRAFVERGGVIEPWTVQVEASATGAFRIDGEVGALLPRVSGRLRLWFALAPLEAMPTAEAVRAAAPHPEAELGFQLLSYAVEIAE